MPVKDLILTPGPSQVPEQVRLALAKPAWHHRTPRFRTLYKETRERAGRIFSTKNEVFIFASSGTGAMEASLINAIPKGKKALVVSAGKWGERLVQICEAFGIARVVVELEYGDDPSPERIAAELEKDPDIAGVYLHLCETCTGAKYDVRGIGEVVKKTDAFLAVDGISGAVGMKCPLDEWGVDLFMVGSQKGLMMPPGLALLFVSEKAWRYVEQTKAPSAYYFDLRRYRKVLPKNDTPFTPANTLIDALNEALKMIEEEGPENVQARHALLAKAARAGFAALGLELFPKHPAEVLTVVKTPPGLDSRKVTDRTKNRYGITLANGQGDLKGKIIRLAHMGYCSGTDILVGLAVVEMALKDAGAKVKLGAGVAAAEDVLTAAPAEILL